MAFKKGDRVEYVAAGHMALSSLVGKQGTIDQDTTYNALVRWDHAPNEIAAYRPEYLRLVKPKLDLTKPVRCSLPQGEQVRILCTDAPGKFPVVGLITYGTIVSMIGRWTLEGKGLTCPDLENVPPEPVKKTVYEYLLQRPCGKITVHRAGPAWDKSYGGNARLLARKEVTITEGEGLE